MILEAPPVLTELFRGVSPTCTARPTGKRRGVAEALLHRGAVSLKLRWKPSQPLRRTGGVPPRL